MQISIYYMKIMIKRTAIHEVPFINWQKSNKCTLKNSRKPYEVLKLNQSQGNLSKYIDTALYNNKTSLILKLYYVKSMEQSIWNKTYM